MVIHSNAQSASSASAGTGIHTKLHRKQKPEEANAPTENEADVTISARSRNRAPSEIPPISDENRAEEVTEFLRHHILTRPAASISVQANSRPQAVFELLDGIFE